MFARQRVRGGRWSLLAFGVSLQMLAWMPLAGGLCLLTGAGCPPGPPDNTQPIPDNDDEDETEQDHDGDGQADATDNCPAEANADQADTDGDTIGDVCDNCPALANTDQRDDNFNGIGDACEPLGAWQYQSGPIFSQNTRSTPTFIVFNLDGSAKLFFREQDSGVLECGDALFATIDRQSLFLDVPEFFDVRLFRFELPAATTLILTDNVGAASTFTRVDAVPAEFQCGTLTVVQRFDNINVRPHSFSGMAFDGTSLWFEEDNNRRIHPFNPQNGTLGAFITLAGSQFSHVHAMQGADFWAHCGCGGSEDVQRRTAADVLVDTVNTRTDLNNEISVRAIAYDNTGNILWLHGFSFDDDVQRFLKINANAEPDVLLQAADFNISLRALTFDGTSLWAVTGFGPGGQEIVQINPATLKAVATFEAPDDTVGWQGIAPDGAGGLFLLGEVSSKAVIVKVQP